MIVLGILLGLLVALCLLPVGVQVKYDAGGAEARAVCGPVSLRLYPKKKKSVCGKKKEKSDSLKAKAGQSHKLKIGGALPLFRELLGTGLELLGCIRRKLTVKNLYMDLTVGGQGDDPAGAAILYGRAWAAVGALTPVMENTFRIKNRDVQVQIDFSATENRLYCEACVLFLLGDLLWMAVHYGFRMLTIFMKHRKKGRIKHGTSNQ